MQQWCERYILRKFHLISILHLQPSHGLVWSGMIGVVGVIMKWTLCVGRCPCCGCTYLSKLAQQEQEAVIVNGKLSKRKI